MPGPGRPIDSPRRWRGGARGHGAWRGRPGGSPELGIGQLVEHLAEGLAALGASPPRTRALLGQGDADDPSVGGAPLSGHEPALFHAVHDAGRAGPRDVQSLRQAAHGLRPIVLEDAQHVEVHQADGTARAPAHDAHDRRRRVPEELVEAAHRGDARADDRFTS